MSLYVYLLSMSILFAHFVYLHYSYKQSSNCVVPVAVSCGPAPDAPTNGQRSGSGTTYGSTVTYSCSTGYTLQGDNGHTCMANGQWSGKTPTCKRKLLAVQLLLLHVYQVSIRAMILQHDDSWGFYCSYNESCTCALPVAVSCGPAPDAPANGQRTGSGTTFRSAVTYSCDQGYTQEGPSRLTCTHLKLWSGTAPTCNRKLLAIRCHYRYTWASKSIRAMMLQCDDSWCSVYCDKISIPATYIIHIQKYPVFGNNPWTNIKRTPTLATWNEYRQGCVQGRQHSLFH